jgi:DUF177 domain-containing protein
MRIHVETLPAEGVELEIDEPVKQFPVLLEMQAQGECRFLDSVRGHLRVRKVTDLVTVVGTVSTRVRLTCDRCLRRYETDLMDRMAVSYTRNLPEPEDPEEETALSAEDLGLIAFHGDVIELREAIQEQVVLSFPVHPVCAQDCKGLCPHCGEDLNRGPCACKAADAVDPRFAALRSLKLPDRKE